MATKDIPDLRKHKPFSGLKPEAYQYLQKRLQQVEITENQTVVTVGERRNLYAIITHGRIQLSAPNGENKILVSGQSFGLDMIRFGVPSVFTAKAETDCILFVIHRIDWLVARELSQIIPHEKVPVRPRRFWMWALVLMGILAISFTMLGPDFIDFTNNRLTTYALDYGYETWVEEYLSYGVHWQPKSAQLFDNLGYILYNQDKKPQALEAFKHAVRQNEYFASAQNNLGVALLEQEEFGAAIEHINNAVQLDPGNQDAYKNLGDAYLAAGDRGKAAKAYQHAFELDQDQLDAKAMWAGISLGEGNLSEAWSAWEQVLVSKPDHVLAQRGMGVIALLQGKAEKALPYLMAARLLDPADAATRLYLGLALEELDHFDDAEVEFSQALMLSNDPALVSLAKSHLITIHNRKLGQGNSIQKGDDG